MCTVIWPSLHMLLTEQLCPVMCCVVHHWPAHPGSTLDAAEAKRCDPALRACSGEKILIGGHGRVTIRYTTSHTFSILPDTFVEDLLVTGIYNGQAAGQGEPHNLLPLTR